jgi:hypothetical protein
MDVTHGDSHREEGLEGGERGRAGAPQSNIRKASGCCRDTAGRGGGQNADRKTKKGELTMDRALGRSAVRAVETTPPSQS